MLSGLLEAAGYGGWQSFHVRRSDLALTMGSPGFPDIVLCHEQRQAALVIECKAQGGRFRPGQRQWLDAFTAAGVEARVCTPAEYDATVVYLLGDRIATPRRRRWTDHPEHDG